MTGHPLTTLPAWQALETHAAALRETHLREQMVELIKIVEGFYACGVAASTYGTVDP